MEDTNGLRRMQYAALPYRQRQDGEVQVRLITSRETRRWVIPKGWPMKGIAPHKTAAREAYEEAGLLGAISSTAIGLYGYDKRLSSVRSVPCDVMVFPLKVKRYLKKWPERSQRVGFWFSIEAAAAVVHEPELKNLILHFGATMAERHAAKLVAKAQAALVRKAAQLEAKRAEPAGESAMAAGKPVRVVKKRKAETVPVPDAAQPQAEAAPVPASKAAKPKAAKAPKSLKSPKAPKAPKSAKAAKPKGAKPAKSKAPGKAAAGTSVDAAAQPAELAVKPKLAKRAKAAVKVAVEASEAVAAVPAKSASKTAAGKKKSVVKAASAPKADKPASVKPKTVKKGGAPSSGGTTQAAQGDGKGGHPGTVPHL